MRMKNTVYELYHLKIYYLYMEIKTNIHKIDDTSSSRHAPKLITFYKNHVHASRALTSVDWSRKLINPKDNDSSARRLRIRTHPWAF